MIDRFDSPNARNTNERSSGQATRVPRQEVRPTRGNTKLPQTKSLWVQTEDHQLQTDSNGFKPRPNAQMDQMAKQIQTKVKKCHKMSNIVKHCQTISKGPVSNRIRLFFGKKWHRDAPRQLRGNFEATPRQLRGSLGQSPCSSRRRRTVPARNAAVLRPETLIVLSLARKDAKGIG